MKKDQTIRKRNGKVVKFQREKIFNAIWAAVQADAQWMASPAATPMACMRRNDIIFSVFYVFILAYSWIAYDIYLICCPVP